jgi:thiol-disulfide isomerase/thioredoxin
MSFAVVSSGDDCGEACIDHHLTEPGIHLFTVSWCGHCKTMLAQHTKHMALKKKEAERYKEEFNNVTNVKVVKHDREEFDEDELDKMYANGEIEGYPTIYFVKEERDGTKKKTVYRGSRELSDLNMAYKQFVRSIA